MIPDKFTFDFASCPMDRQIQIYCYDCQYCDDCLEGTTQKALKEAKECLDNHHKIPDEFRFDFSYCPMESQTHNFLFYSETIPPQVDCVDCQYCDDCLKGTIQKLLR